MRDFNRVAAEKILFERLVSANYLKSEWLNELIKLHEMLNEFYRRE